MNDQVAFLEKHKRLREASETVLFMESPRRWGKSLLQESMLNTKDKFVTMYGGAYDVKSLAFPQKFYLIKRTKLLKSKSKQSRIVSVVCK